MDNKNEFSNTFEKANLKSLISKILFGCYLILLVGIVAYALLFVIMSLI